MLYWDFAYNVWYWKCQNPHSVGFRGTLKGKVGSKGKAPRSCKMLWHFKCKLLPQFIQCYEYYIMKLFSPIVFFFLMIPPITHPIWSLWPGPVVNLALTVKKSMPFHQKKLLKIKYTDENIVFPTIYFLIPFTQTSPLNYNSNNIKYQLWCTILYNSTKFPFKPPVL